MDNPAQPLMSSNEDDPTTIEIVSTSDISLTEGLSNAGLFKQILNRAISRARRLKMPVALLMVEIVNLAEIRQSLEPGLVDLLLRLVRDRLQSTLRYHDIIVHLSGGEFGIMLDEGGHYQYMGVVSRRLLDMMEPIFNVAGIEIKVNANVGIACYPMDGEQMKVLEQHAYVALYKAKLLGFDHYQYANPDLQEQDKVRVKMLTSLRRALYREEFHLVYQPIFDLKGHDVVAYEAFIRWDHPQGIIGPKDFLPFAEESGLILPLGEWILNTACQAYQQFPRTEQKPSKICVKIAQQQFLQDDFLQSVHNALDKTQINPHDLILEVKETVLVACAHESKEKFQALSQLGIEICIGSFGMSQIDLCYLKESPISSVKINRSLLQHCVQNAKDAAHVKIITNIAHAFGFKMMANGVETKPQLQFLAKNECDQAQGYMLCRPLKAELIVNCLRANEKMYMKN